eukprot:CAMPEP_0197584474 /NCGR_PEP_ID=MMETSP1326-20131121/7089_1 /TAXON_ID=1155430 /ORGANISM="Genus nov. species nov., Strain RCC2288" /LENGTH=152 /DNA_ID=CAMNT_0043148847 /DNA_START=179 /DNA_END=634 /DNA_ORIENTATION=-
MDARCRGRSLISLAPPPHPAAHAPTVLRHGRGHVGLQVRRVPVVQHQVRVLPRPGHLDQAIQGVVGPEVQRQEALDQLRLLEHHAAVPLARLVGRRVHHLLEAVQQRAAGTRAARPSNTWMPAAPASFALFALAAARFAATVAATTLLFIRG